MSALGNLIEKPARTALDNLQKTAPAQIDKALASGASSLTGSVAVATELFTRVYTSATTGIAAWLPSLRPRLLALVSRGVAWGKAYITKL